MGNSSTKALEKLKRSRAVAIKGGTSQCVKARKKRWLSSSGISSSKC